MQTNPQPGVLWRVIVVLAGLLALLIGYYWVHKPANLGLFLTFGGAALDLATVGLIALVAGGLGRRVLERWITFENISMPERIALECGIGLGILSIIVVAFGMVGLLKAPVLWAILVLLAILTLSGIRAWASDCLTLSRSIRPTSHWTRFLALFVNLSLAIALLHALAPPTAWDALMYHLVGPEAYLAAERITAIPDNHYLGFPQGVEMLFALATGLFGRDTSSAPVHFLFGILTLLAAGGITARYADAAAAWLTMTLLMSSYSMWLLFGWPYVDLAVMVYGLLALIAIIQWRELQSDKWLALAGVFAGMMIGVKYTSGLVLVALCVYALYHAPRKILRNGLILCMAALLIFLPWMIRGLVLYNNPIYPFFFGGLDWDAIREQAFNPAGTGLLSGTDAWQLLILPLSATIFGVEKGSGFAFTTGPWLLTLPLILLVGWRWLDDRARKLASTCLLMMAVLLIFWMILAARWVLGMTPRQLSLLVALSAVAGGLGFYSLSQWPRKSFDLYFIARGILAFTLILGLIEMFQATIRSQVVPYFFGSISRSGYLDGEIGLYMNAMHQLDSLPEGAHVRILWEPRAYYCPSSVICSADVATDFWSYPIRNGFTPDEVFANWQAEGIHYLMVFDLGYDFYTNQDTRFAAENRLFPEALQGWMIPVWSDDFAYTLYTWRSSRN